MKIVYCHFKDVMKHCSSWRCLLTPSFTQASTQWEIDCPFLSASAVWTKAGGVTEPHLQQRFKSILHLAQLLPSSFLHFHFTRKIANSIYPCEAWLCHSGSKLIIDFLLMISPVTPAHSAVDGDFVFLQSGIDPSKLWPRDWFAFRHSKYCHSVFQNRRCCPIAELCF